VTTGIQMQRCTRCATVAFPFRLLCPHCRGHEFENVMARQGTVEEWTAQHTEPPTRFASVRCDLGPIVVAAVHGPPITPGMTIELTSIPPTAPDNPIGYVPTPHAQEKR